MGKILPPQSEENTSADQLELFARDRWPRRPYCSDDPRGGVQIRGLAEASQRSHIQPNHPSILWRLVLDVDAPGAAWPTYWGDYCGAPAPSIAIENPATRHAHIAYEIEIPVSRSGDTPAMRLAGAVEAGIAQLLGADPDYTATLMQTPHHESWCTYAYRDQWYDLTELAEWLPESVANDARWRDRRRTPPTDHPLGRNCALFHALRHWAYRAVRDYWAPGGESAWRDAVERRAGEINQGFDLPLDPLEVAHSAKSVARWTWTHLTPEGWAEYVQRTHTPDVQARRGQRGGQVSRGGGRPRTTADSRPWEDECIDRATWYRRRRKRATKQA